MKCLVLNSKTSNVELNEAENFVREQIKIWYGKEIMKAISEEMLKKNNPNEIYDDK